MPEGDAAEPDHEARLSQSWVSSRSSRSIAIDEEIDLAAGKIALGGPRISAESLSSLLRQLKTTTSTKTIKEIIERLPEDELESLVSEFKLSDARSVRNEYMTEELAMEHKKRARAAREAFLSAKKLFAGTFRDPSRLSSASAEIVKDSKEFSTSEGEHSLLDVDRTLEKSRRREISTCSRPKDRSRLLTTLTHPPPQTSGPNTRALRAAPFGSLRKRARKEGKRGRSLPRRACRGPSSTIEVNR